MAIPCSNMAQQNVSPDKPDAAKMRPQTPIKSDTFSFQSVHRASSPATSSTESTGEELSMFDKVSVLRNTAASPTSDPEPENDCIFVGNLPKKYTKIQLEKIVRQLFASYGPVDYTKASMDKKGRPYCFVKFLNCAVPRQVLLQEIVLDSRVLRVEMAKGQPIKSVGIGGNINGNAFYLTGGFGSPCNAIGYGKNDYSKGINPTSDASGDIPFLSNGLNSLSLEQGRAQRSNATADESSETNVIRVCGLSSIFVSETLLIKYFEKYGIIVEVRIVNSPIRNAPDSCCFKPQDKRQDDEVVGHFSAADECTALIKFQDTLSARRAIFSEDGNTWLGNKLRVFFERPCLNPSISHPSPPASVQERRDPVCRAVTPPASVSSKPNGFPSGQLSNPFIHAQSSSYIPHSQGHSQSKRFPIGQYEMSSVGSGFSDYPNVSYNLDQNSFVATGENGDCLQVTLPSFSSLPPGLPSFSQSTFNVPSINGSFCFESLGFDILNSPPSNAPLLPVDLNGGGFRGDAAITAVHLDRDGKPSVSGLDVQPS